MKAEFGPAKLEVTEADYEAIQKISKVGIFQILSDQFGYWRQLNLIRISEKFKIKCEKKGIDPKKVSPKFLAQFIEAASLDEDADIQDMWANLLVQEAQAPGTISLRTISSLKSLSKDEANAFQDLYANAFRPGNEIAIYNDRNDSDKAIGDIIKLVDCGLIVSESTYITYTITVPAQGDDIIARSPRNKYIIIAQNKSVEERKFAVPIFSLTKAGQDILNATLGEGTDDEYSSMAKKIKSKNHDQDILVRLYKIENMDEINGDIRYNNKDILEQIRA